MLTKSRVEECITPAQLNIILNSRVFWRELAAWTRIYFRSRYLGIGDPDEAFRRLYNTPYNFTSNLQLIFGSRFAEEYTLLMNRHVIVLRELISAQLEGNIEAIERNVDLLYQNSAERARLLSEYNPFWNEAEWRNLFDTYLQLTLEEANTFASDDHIKSIEMYEHIISNANLIGDYFSQGLFNYIVYNPQDNIPQNRRYGNGTPCITYGQMNTIFDLRMLWFELTVWIRALFIVIFEGVGEPENVLARIDTIVRDYRNIISAFIGEQAADEYIEQVYADIGRLFALFHAQREGDTEAIDRYTRAIYQDVNRLASYLASVDPDFDLNVVNSMLTNFTRYTLDSATAYLTGDYARSLDNFDRLLRLSLELGDVFAFGLFAQDQQ